jgi:LCP family protein required for cell wall assembly
MHIDQKPLVLMLFAAALVGCGAAFVAGLPAGLASNAGALQATYVVPPEDATATPTPFQPLPPTAVLMETQAALTQAQPLPGNLQAGTPSPAPIGTPTPTITIPANGFPEQTQIAQPTGQINILFLGSDRRPESSGFRTDTIVLACINFDLGRVNLLSFPRDLFINQPGRGMDRINTSWTYGGYKLLRKVMAYNFGVTPDYYVLINFDGFKKVIDSLGGLDVDVGTTVSDYRNGYWTTIKKGNVHMDADLALWYVRTRKTTNDIARNKRQQEVIDAIFNKILSIDGIRRAPELYLAYKDNVKTDIGLPQILSWLPFAAKIAETREIHHYFLTYKHVNDYITPAGAMVLVPNMNLVMDMVRKVENLP